MVGNGAMPAFGGEDMKQRVTFDWGLRLFVGRNNLEGVVLIIMPSKALFEREKIFSSKTEPQYHTRTVTLP